MGYICERIINVKFRTWTRLEVKVSAQKRIPYFFCLNGVVIIFANVAKCKLADKHHVIDKSSSYKNSCNFGRACNQTDFEIAAYVIVKRHYLGVEPVELQFETDNCGTLQTPHTDRG